jgi:hypothetical protein
MITPLNIVSLDQGKEPVREEDEYYGRASGWRALKWLLPVDRRKSTEDRRFRQEPGSLAKACETAGRAEPLRSIGPGPRIRVANDAQSPSLALPLQAVPADLRRRREVDERDGPSSDSSDPGSFAVSQRSTPPSRCANGQARF